MTTPASISGILVIDKPLRMTSMSVCAKIRGKLHAGLRNMDPEASSAFIVPKRIKVGHGGTLDPLATGVLVILVGKATTLCDRVMAGDKEYLATVDLSRTSPTDDLEAQATTVEGVEPPTRAQLETACATYTGVIEQIPPDHSAIKIDGKRAYASARAGEAPRLKPRPVRIDAIEILGYQWPLADLRITCGKGVYIRSLARDLGRALQTGGVLTALRRTQVGQWSIEQAIRVEDLPDPMVPSDLLPVPSSPVPSSPNPSSPEPDLGAEP